MIVAASLKDSRLLFNFGDQTLEFHPGGPFTPVALASDDSQVPNRNTGWRLNPYDTSAGLDVSPDGSMAQAQFNQGWQGCRANQVVIVFFGAQAVLGSRRSEWIFMFR